MSTLLLAFIKSLVQVCLTLVCLHFLTVCRNAIQPCFGVQREGVAEDVPTGSRANQAPADLEVLTTTNANTQAESGNKHKRVLRTYGQKKAKADSSADQATATLSSDFLALVGGQR